VWLSIAAHGATQTTRKSTGKTSAASAKKRSTAKGKKAVPNAAARTRQISPTADRYKEIQRALAAKGYLSPEQATGQWTDSSADALKRFQTDQNLDATGKINSLSLIALGLGPKRENAALTTTQ
jgi:hypothetical protein